ncbi:MAG: prenyltransferase/squalene oxidase repeat-containing protein [Planctomycetota bacterium]
MQGTSASSNAGGPDDEATIEENPHAEESRSNRFFAMVGVIRSLGRSLKLPFIGQGSNRDWTRTPAFLVSLIAHTALLLLLTLWSVVRLPSVGGETEYLSAVNVRDAQPIELVKMELAVGDAPPPPNPVDSREIATPTANSQSATEIVSELLVERAPLQRTSESKGELERLLEATSLDLSASFAATGVEGRSLPNRKKIALSRGGTIESEKAVEDALVWLAAHQRPNGSWSLVHSAGVCNGRCTHDGSKERFDTAATGLSLLAFLGAGYTHRDGLHRETVRKGVYFLLQVMEETPEGGSFIYQSDRGMYNHGIAAFALCEAYQLTKDKDLAVAAQQCIDFIVAAQTYRGGWGYLPQRPGDLTLSGWQIMALKSAYAAGLSVPDRTIMRIDTFLASQQAKDGVYYGYGKPGRSPTCTAIGNLLRLFRGRSHTDPNILEAAEYFRRVGKSNSDVYFNYYTTLFLFHIGGPLWDNWHPTVRDHLVKTQSRTGHEAGSWYFDNPYGKEGGRLYTTAMAAMTLEVYYRYSPLYQQVDVSFEL